MKAIAHNKKNGLLPWEYLLLVAAVVFVFFCCVSAGSVAIGLKNVWQIIFNGIFKTTTEAGPETAIVINVRIPRVLTAALMGAALSLCGACMQGLLKNPLADGSTLGVSSGASLGAVAAIAFGLSIPGLSLAGTMVMAITGAMASLIVILALAYRLDRTLATNTIILVGIIFSMFASSIITLITVMASDKVKSITFWTMGSLSSSSYTQVCILAAVLAVCSVFLLSNAEELNATSIGEDNARSVGVNVKRVRLTVLIAVSVLIGVCVSIGGTIAFVGLVIPHIVRMITGPNHKKLLPVSMFSGAVFLMLCDLAARTVLAPSELPVGAITSFIGAIVFVIIFARQRHIRA